MYMPFWKSELYVEISPWFPFGKDYQPVSVNRFYDSTLKQIASSCLDLGSEFFFMASPQTGCVGNLPRENFFKYGPDTLMNLGFLMILGYSDYMERSIIASLGLLESAHGLFPGITSCSLWSRGVFHGTAKVIAIASNEPFYDCTEYLKGLAGVLSDSKKFFKTGDNAAYYAEKFGYERFFIQWEHDNPIDLRVSQLLAEFELEGTKEIVGDSSDVDFPPFMGAAVSMLEMK
ncbi:MAG: hypothetical protein IJP48_06755 [Synergistaceae bacterium]|nr:hypothetical protein [Synergistaceae bacterium]